MAPITLSQPINNQDTPRVVIYHQTHFLPNGSYVSLRPLITERTGVTHVIVAAIHINGTPGDLTLNDDPWSLPSSPSTTSKPVLPSTNRLQRLLSDIQDLQAAGIRVLGMLGGAAVGTHTRLDGPSFQFEAFYAPLRDAVRAWGLDGLDLDVEEPMSLAGIIRLIDRLCADFGPDFLITLAPVAAAMVGADGATKLSGFSYLELEKAMGRHIAWYNTQFYCGWGSAETTEHYDAIISRGWDPSKVVLGLVTNPANGQGWVFEELLMATLAVLRDVHPGFGGVMGWEYFNSLSSMAGAGAGEQGGKPWLWVKGMSSLLGREVAASGDDDGKPIKEPGTTKQAREQSQTLNAEANEKGQDKSTTSTTADKAKDIETQKVQPTQQESMNSDNPFLQLLGNQVGSGSSGGGK